MPEIIKKRIVGKSTLTKKSKKRRNWVLIIALIGFSLYIALMIVDQQIKISEARSELSDLNKTISLQEIKNEELKTIADSVDSDDLSSFSDYIERVARKDLDYVKNGEVVFINIAGD